MVRLSSPTCISLIHCKGSIVLSSCSSSSPPFLCSSSFLFPSFQRLSDHGISTLTLCDEAGLCTRSFLVCHERLSIAPSFSASIRHCRQPLHFFPRFCQSSSSSHSSCFCFLLIKQRPHFAVEIRQPGEQTTHARSNLHRACHDLHTNSRLYLLFFSFSPTCPKIRFQGDSAHLTTLTTLMTLTKSSHFFTPLFSPFHSSLVQPLAGKL